MTEYRAKSDHDKTVKAIEEKDGYVRFRISGIETLVAAKRFHKVYEMAPIKNAN